MAVLKPAVLAVLLAMGLIPGAWGQAADPAEIAFAKSQAAIGNRVGNHLLIDMNGERLRLGELMDRPLVISLVYTSCGTVCPVVSDHLRDTVADARQALGADSFNVLTFGFDARGDTPEQLRGFAASHRLEGNARWQVAAADPATTEVLLREVGFSYEDIAGGFRHVTQTTILDADGRVFRQIYGEDFPAPMLVEPLKQLVLGGAALSPEPADLWKRLTFLCTTYDPTTGAYRFDYAIFFGIFFGGLSLILTALVIFRLWRERRRALRAQGAGTARRSA